MSKKPKKNLMPLLQNLDQRADNYFAYDKEAEAYILASTYQVRVHKVDTPPEQYELVYWRAGVKFEHEPTEADFVSYKQAVDAELEKHFNAGIWSSEVDEQGEPAPFTFDTWKIKDHREA